MEAFNDSNLAQLTGLLYDTVTDDGAWSRVMELAKTRGWISGGAFGFLDFGSGRQLRLHGDCPAEYGETFVEEHVANPFAPRVAGAPVGEVVTDGMLMSRNELKRSTFYNEWLRPQGEHSVMTVALWRNGGSGAHFSVMRGGRQPAFDAGDVALVARLLPTMRRVASLRVALGARQLAMLADEHDASGTGMLVLDADGRLLFANVTGEGFLQQPGSELRVRHGHLLAARRTHERLRRALHAACHDLSDLLASTGDMLVTERHSGRALATLSVLPLHDAPGFGLPVGRAALLLLRDLTASRTPDGFTRRLRNLFELTPREAELAVSLGQGNSVQDFAAGQQISVATARTHLASLFRKTETTRQGELMALLYRIGRRS